MTAPASEQRRVAVGIGQLVVSKDPRDVLVAYGLGSCVAVAAYDVGAKVAGLVHVLLPASEGKASAGGEPARFADVGVDELLRRLAEAGALRARLVIKLAGGAAVLGAANAEKFKIGERNAEAIQERLQRHGLRAASCDLGGTRGRTLELHVAAGRTYVRMAAGAPTEL
ncbi:MAG: chemotaxis protein CheD [Dehalococcoidia bacterium]|nr:chemotaxis protein CheD [Dehalococcoidia bacterium]